MAKVEWRDLPEELIDLIASRSSSNIDLLRIRSICKPWRSAVATKKHFPNDLKRNLRPFGKRFKKTELLPSTFFRVTKPSSSCPNKGWLFKTREVASKSSKTNLFSLLSNEQITSSYKTLDLLNFGVSETCQSYNVQCLNKNDKILDIFSTVVSVDNRVFLIDRNKKIWCCKSGEESSRNKWTRIKNEDCGEFFLDIILYKGQVYALDLKGGVWWINLHDLNIYQYGPSTPMEEYYEIDHCKDKRLVEYCGDLCVVHRNFSKQVSTYWYTNINRSTYNFKVYKMDKELVKWMEVNSLEDKALIVDKESCFTVLASEYYGCLKNAIYFFDEYRDGKKRGGVKVLKLDDRSIINMTDSSSKNCFQMFSPSPFLCK